ncbi:unnamed protein product (plasmid) [Mycetohabitans rhizoxinica HKI 454]|uniref:Uncharacterized protein n=1 Tax=Mycetohabitans rhizoxinica (strain DSM 19002 / CIP 109453 / HKI 454) TaxID=882378 RepID=E5AUV0_MYCRK|nr:unnamed protein product [Mycetohabitans rhizoxinica HKI 454]
MTNMSGYAPVAPHAAGWPCSGCRRRPGPVRHPWLQGGHGRPHIGIRQLDIQAVNFCEGSVT